MSSYTLHGDDFSDTVVATLKDLGDEKAIAIATSHQEYEFFQQWLKKDKVNFDGGYGIQQTLRDKLHNVTSMVGINEPDSVTLTNLLTSITIPWRHASSYWVYNKTLDLMNKSAKKINDILQERKANCFEDQAEKLNAKCLACPDSENDQDPYGLGYWITAKAATTTPGFNGFAPVGHSTIAGLTVSSTSHAHYANYCGLYTTVSEGDLLKKLRVAARAVNWRSPVGKEQFTGPLGNDFRLYCSNATYTALEDLLISRNDNLGADLGAVSSSGLAKFEGYMTYYMHPVLNISEMDTGWDVTSGYTTATGKNTIFGVNHRSFFPVALSGAYFEENGPHDTDCHLTKAMFVDTTFNIFCKNRRVNFRFDQV